MKQITIIAAWLCAIMAALVSGCQVSVTPGSVAVAAPAPAVVVAPALYVWDGVEFVGEYNGQYMYCNPAGVWVACDAVVLDRFHGYERLHPDWRASAFHNEGDHRLDRDHRPAEARRSVAPEKRTAASEKRKADPDKKDEGK